MDSVYIIIYWNGVRYYNIIYVGNSAFTRCSLGAIRHGPGEFRVVSLFPNE